MANVIRKLENILQGKNSLKKLKIAQGEGARVWRGEGRVLCWLVDQGRPQGE